MTTIEQAMEIGLEDLIPLPELLDMPEIRDVVGGSPGVEMISNALITLLRLGRISVWKGRWDAEPQRVSQAEAEELLRHSRRYSFTNKDKGLQRIYSANVENIP